jgi:hypothetical protein
VANQGGTAGSKPPVPVTNLLRGAAGFFVFSFPTIMRRFLYDISGYYFDPAKFLGKTELYYSTAL